MGRSRYRSSSYRKPYTFSNPSPAARLQFQDLVDLIESEGQTLARRSSNVLGQMSSTLAANLTAVQKVLDAPSMEEVVEQRAQQLMLAEAEVARLQTAANAAYHAQPLLKRWLGGIPQPLRGELETARRELSMAQSSWDTRARGSTSSGVPLELSHKPAAQAFVGRARAAQEILQGARQHAAQREQQRGMAQQHRQVPRTRTQVMAARDEAAAAKAAAFDGRVRQQAETVKRSLPRNHPCPYCGGSLGSDANADHIHPVSHGGMSSSVNMVYVCKSCNLKKSDLTLREFARRQGLNREVIEARLEKLGKRI